jgi:hypothetical protein
MHGRKKMSACRVLKGKTEATTKTYARWEDNNKMDLRELD